MGDRFNNCVANLEWVTSKENTKHAVQAGLVCPPTGEFRSDVTYNKELILSVLFDFYYSFLLCTEIEQKYNLPNHYAPLIVKGKRWVGVYAEFISGREDYCEAVLKILSKRRNSNRQRVEQEVRNATAKLAQ